MLENIKNGPTDILFLNLPAFYEVLNQSHERGEVKAFKFWPKYFKKRSDVPLISLMDFLPMNAPYQERYAWFLLPYDGHPRNKGAELYAKVAADVVAQYIIRELTGKGGSVTVDMETIDRELERASKFSVQNKNKAMEYLLEARDAHRLGDLQNAYNLFSRAIELYPSVGQPGLIYYERVQIAIA